MSKGLEALKEIKYMLDAPYTSGIIKQGFDTIEKELKALEIIRKKHIHKCVLDTFEQDWNLIEVKGKDITQEEYVILKEALL